MALDDHIKRDSVTVIHWCHNWLSQTETWLYNQVRYLPEHVDSHVVCESTSNLEQFELPNIHSFSEAPKWRNYWERGLRKLYFRTHLGYLVTQLQKRKTDILHSHYGPQGWASLGAVRGTGVKHVVTFYGADVSRTPSEDKRWQDRYKTLFREADAVFCEGPYMRNSLIDLGCPEDKVHVQHLGVPVSEIVFRPRTYKIGERLQVLMAGSFREKKGIPYAIEALGRLNEETPVDVTIIGDTVLARDKDEKRRILDTIDRWKLRPFVRLLGYQPHETLIEEATKHHVFLAPSVHASDGDSEGGAPIVLLEMAAAGLAIVGTTHCDIPEVIRNGQTGLLAPEHDAEALLGHLRTLVAAPERWQKMLVAGRRHIETNYSAVTQGRRLSMLYDSILGS